MRFRRPTLAAVALVSVLAAAPTIASAFRHPSFFTRCHVNVEVAPKEISSGDPVVVFGRLACRRPANASGQVVRLYHHLRGVPGYSFVQSTTTDTSGFYEFANADAPVTSNRVFFVRSHGAQSGLKGVKVAAEVNLSGPPEGTQLYTGRANEVTFTGTVSPADAGARVVLQRQNALTGNEWHAIDRGIVGPEGAFSIVHAFRYPGDADIRVLVLSQGRNIRSESNILSYEISQAQNPDLTISSSADPIAFGQSVTISGTLAAGANQPVTLYARIARQHYGAIAQVNTDALGNYTFPAQSPVHSTFYEVQGAGKRSAVLYEGVKDVLTAAVSQTTIQAGMPVTFTGTVEPDHTGEIIYLERKNASSDGYHVIQVVTIGAGSTYSIEHRFYDPGSKTVRVYVPGSPENGAAASPPFTINVTPAPASALTPEAQSNTSLPAEGQRGGSGAEESPREVGLEEAELPTEPGGETGKAKEHPGHHGRRSAR